MLPSDEKVTGGFRQGSVKLTAAQLYVGQAARGSAANNTSAWVNGVRGNTSYVSPPVSNHIQNSTMRAELIPAPHQSASSAVSIVSMPPRASARPAQASAISQPVHHYPTTQFMPNQPAVSPVDSYPQQNYLEHASMAYEAPYPTVAHHQQVSPGYPSTQYHQPMPVPYPIVPSPPPGFQSIQPQASQEMYPVAWSSVTPPPGYPMRCPPQQQQQKPNKTFIHKVQDLEVAMLADMRLKNEATTSNLASSNYSYPEPHLGLSSYSNNCPDERKYQGRAQVFQLKSKTEPSYETAPSKCDSGKDGPKQSSVASLFDLKLPDYNFDATGEEPIRTLVFTNTKQDHINSGYVRRSLRSKDARALYKPPQERNTNNMGTDQPFEPGRSSEDKSQMTQETSARCDYSQNSKPGFRDERGYRRGKQEMIQPQEDHQKMDGKELGENSKNSQQPSFNSKPKKKFGNRRERFGNEEQRNKNMEYAMNAEATQTMNKAPGRKDSFRRRDERSSESPNRTSVKVHEPEKKQSSERQPTNAEATQTTNRAAGKRGSFRRRDERSSESPNRPSVNLREPETNQNSERQATNARNVESTNRAAGKKGSFRGRDKRSSESPNRTSVKVREPETNQSSERQPTNAEATQTTNRAAGKRGSFRRRDERSSESSNRPSVNLREPETNQSYERQSTNARNVESTQTTNRAAGKRGNFRGRDERSSESPNRPSVNLHEPETNQSSEWRPTNAKNVESTQNMNRAAGRGSFRGRDERSSKPSNRPSVNLREPETNQSSERQSTNARNVESTQNTNRAAGKRGSFRGRDERSLESPNRPSLNLREPEKSQSSEWRPTNAEATQTTNRAAGHRDSFRRRNERSSESPYNPSMIVPEPEKSQSSEWPPTNAKNVESTQNTIRAAGHRDSFRGRNERSSESPYNPSVIVPEPEKKHNSGKQSTPPTEPATKPAASIEVSKDVNFPYGEAKRTKKRFGNRGMNSRFPAASTIERIDTNVSSSVNVQNLKLDNVEAESLSQMQSSTSSVQHTSNLQAQPMQEPPKVAHSKYVFQENSHLNGDSQNEKIELSTTESYSKPSFKAQGSKSPSKSDSPTKFSAGSSTPPSSAGGCGSPIKSPSQTKTRESPGSASSTKAKKYKKIFDSWSGKYIYVEDAGDAKQAPTSPKATGSPKKPSLTFKTGDLFTTPADFSLAHCVAEDMRMGAGIAVAFRQQFRRIPELLNQYQETGGLAVLNDISKNPTSGEEIQRYIYYLVTKKQTHGKPTLATLRSSLLKLHQHCSEHGVRNLAMPRIGSGLDLLDWQQVQQMIEEIFGKSKVSVSIYTLEKDWEKEETTIQAYSFRDVEKTSLVDLKLGTARIFFASEHNETDCTMEELDGKFRFLSHYKATTRRKGEVYRYESKFPEENLYGLVVRGNRLNEPLDYVALDSALRGLNKFLKKDNYTHMGFEAFQASSDPSAVDKVMTCMRWVLLRTPVHIHICWPGNVGNVG